MSFQEEERAHEKELSPFLTHRDIMIEKGMRAGLSAELILEGVKNGLEGFRGMSEEERTGPKSYVEWRARKAAREGRGVNLVAVDAQGRRVPSTMGNQWAKEIERIVSEDDDFRRLLSRGLVPQEEVDRARAGGLKTWRKLREKYSGPNAPVEDPGFGGAA